MYSAGFMAYIIFLMLEGGSKVLGLSTAAAAGSCSLAMTLTEVCRSSSGPPLCPQTLIRLVFLALKHPHPTCTRAHTLHVVVTAVAIVQGEEQSVDPVVRQLPPGVPQQLVAVVLPLKLSARFTST